MNCDLTSMLYRTIVLLVGIVTNFAEPSIGFAQAPSTHASSWTYKSSVHPSWSYHIRIEAGGNVEVSQSNTDITLDGKLCATSDEFRCIQFNQFEFAIPRDFEGSQSMWTHGNYEFQLAKQPEIFVGGVFLIRSRCLRREESCNFEYEFVFSRIGGLLAFSQFASSHNRAAPPGVLAFFASTDTPGIFSDTGK
jgi:hypothetical protein